MRIILVLTFILSLFETDRLFAQSCDSVIIQKSYYSSGLQFGIPSYTIDSIKNGVKTGTYDLAGNLLVRYDYDGLQRLVARVGADSIAYSYDALSNILSIENYRSSGSVWNYAQDTARMEYYYSGLRLDSLIYYSFNGTQLIPFYRTNYSYNTTDTLTNYNIDLFDTITLNWFTDTTAFVYYFSGLRVDTLISYHPPGVPKYQTRHYDSLERIISIIDYQYIFALEPFYTRSFQYHCNHLSHYSQYYSGSHSAFNYVVNFDSLCRVVKTRGIFSSVNGTIDSDINEYFFSGCSTFAAIAGFDIRLCHGDTGIIPTMAFGGTQPYVIQWSPTTGLLNPNSLNPQIIADSTRDYILTITDLNGITGTDTVNVNVATRPIAAISVAAFDSTTLCQSGMLIADTMSGVFYSWSKIDSIVSYVGSGPVLNINFNATYVLQANENVSYWLVACPFDRDTIVINSFTHSPPVVTTQLRCDHITSNLAPGQQIQWYLQNQLITGAVNDTLHPVQSGYYHAVIIDQNNCPSLNNNAVSYHASATSLMISLAITHPSCLGCSDGVITVNGLGGSSPFRYLINGIRVSRVTDSLTSGTYIVCVEDANNCMVCDSAAFVSIDEQDDSFPVAVYPNPFGKYLNFKLPEYCVENNCFLQIYDVAGKIIYRSPVNDDFVFQRNNVPAGIYFYEVNTGKRIIRGKIVAE